MAKWVLPEGRKPLPDEWFAERAQMQERIKELEAQIKEDALQYLSDTGQMCDRIEELEAKLAKAVEALQGLVPILCEGFEDGCGKLSRHDCAACEGYATLAELTSSVAADNEVKGGKDE